MIKSPYKNIPKKNWVKVTKKLIDGHPLDKDEIVEVILDSWKQLFASKIGKKPFYIGRDIFPKPQIMGFLLHELISLELESRYKNKWRAEKRKDDKDIVYTPDDFYSIEIKTSSSSKSIYGNRSYAQKTKNSKKVKTGFYLAINFEKFTDKNKKPNISKIRFGWLDHNDWLGQKAATGQQSRLSSEVERSKLIELYSINK